MGESGLSEPVVQQEVYSDDNCMAVEPYFDSSFTRANPHGLIISFPPSWLDGMVNRIFNEDCLEGMKRIPDASIDAVVTDPPYGIANTKSFKDKSHGNFKALDASWDIFNSKKDYIEFTSSWLEECERILKPNGSIAVWGSRVSIFDIQPVLNSLFPKFIDMFTWIKRDSPPNMTRRGMAPSTEFCLIYCKSETGWTFNHDDIKKYNNGKQMRNYIDIQRTMTSSERTGHPTQKKLETQMLLAEMLSNKNEIVLDPFVGSGTLPEACLKTERKFIGFELNKEYYSKALNRIRKYR